MTLKALIESLTKRAASLAVQGGKDSADDTVVHKKYS
jgi:hypothetical protein